MRQSLLLYMLLSLFFPACNNHTWNSNNLYNYLNDIYGGKNNKHENNLFIVFNSSITNEILSAVSLFEKSEKCKVILLSSLNNNDFPKKYKREILTVHNNILSGYGNYDVYFI